MPLSIDLPTDRVPNVDTGHTTDHNNTNTAVNAVGAAVDTLTTTVAALSGGAGLAGAAPLAKLRAMLSSRDFAPRVVVCCGDSNTAGVGASTVDNEWVTRFSALLQREYPLATGPETDPLDLDDDPDPEALADGIQIINAGIPGASSSEYINSTTRAQIAALNPCLITHILGFNSNAASIDAEVFISEVQAQITALKAALTEPCVHLLMISFRTASDTYADLWADIADGLAQIADDDPDGDVFAANLTPAYAAAGVPGDDPLDLIDGDQVHMANAGHAMMASLVFDLVTRAPVIPSGGAVTSGGVTTPALTNSVLPAITGTTTQGQTLTAGNGTWSATPDSYTYVWKRGGAAISGATSSTYVLQAADVGAQITVTVTAAKTGYTSAQATSTATAVIASSGGAAGASEAITAVGSLVYTSDNASGSAATLAVSPATVGNLLVLTTCIVTSTSRNISTVSGGGVTTWTKVAGPFHGTAQSRRMEMWIGTVTATGSATITITADGSINGVRVDRGVQEFTSTSGVTWTGDTAGNSQGNSASIDFPSLTPAAANRLYYGYAPLQNAADTVTSGYVMQTGNGNPFIYKLDCDAVQSPSVVHTSSGDWSCLAALVTATPGTPVLTNSVAPTITGTATQGQTLTAGNGTWSATPDSYTYVWKRGGTPISGATASTYVLQLADVGSTITVTVTAIKSGYTSGEATSSATGTVASSGGGSLPTVTSGTLHAWYKADSITGTSDGADYAVWADSSGNGWVTEQPFSNKPTYETNEVNGKPVLRFAADATLRSDASAHMANQTIFAVVKPTTLTGDQTIRSGESGTLQFKMVSGKLTLVKQSIAGIGGGATNLSTSAFSVVAATFTSGTSWAVYLNGTVDGSGSTSVTLDTGTRTHIGSVGLFGGDTLVGDLAELIVYDGVLDSTDRPAVTAYLGSKYGITVS